MMVPIAVALIAAAVAFIGGAAIGVWMAGK